MMIAKLITWVLFTIIFFVTQRNWFSHSNKCIHHHSFQPGTRNFSQCNEARNKRHIGKKKCNCICRQHDCLCRQSQVIYKKTSRTNK